MSEPTMGEIAAARALFEWDAEHMDTECKTWEEIVAKGWDDGYLKCARPMIAAYLAASASVAPAHRSHSTARTPAWSAEEMLLRKMLWLRHGCDGLYGDDGEMQCARCMLDFLRMSPHDIERRFFELRIAKMAVSPSPESRTAPDSRYSKCPCCAGSGWTRPAEPGEMIDV